MQKQGGKGASLKVLKVMRRVGTIVLCSAAFVLIQMATAPNALADPILGTASTFAILGADGVMINGTGSAITGSVGACCGSTAVTGVIPTNFTISGGTVYNTGSLPTGAEISAQADVSTAITALNGVTPVIAESSLDGKTLPPGYYSIGALTLTTTLTLDAEGNSNALWVFLESSTLTTASGSDVTVINDGSGAGVGVYWVMGVTANLGGTAGDSTFYGNVLASTSIVVDPGVTDSCGGLFTTTASVTLAGGDTIGTGCQGGNLSYSPTGAPVITPLEDSRIPEPGTFMLFGAGIACLVARRRASARGR